MSTLKLGCSYSYCVSEANYPTCCRYTRATRKYAGGAGAGGGRAGVFTSTCPGGFHLKLGLKWPPETDYVSWPECLPSAPSALL